MHDLVQNVHPAAPKCDATREKVHSKTFQRLIQETLLHPSLTNSAVEAAACLMEHLPAPIRSATLSTPALSISPTVLSTPNYRCCTATDLYMKKNKLCTATDLWKEKQSEPPINDKNATRCILIRRLRGASSIASLVALRGLFFMSLMSKKDSVTSQANATIIFHHRLKALEAFVQPSPVHIACAPDSIPSFSFMKLRFGVAPCKNTGLALINTDFAGARLKKDQLTQHLQTFLGKTYLQEPLRASYKHILV